jgi:hypothetical protein
MRIIDLKLARTGYTMREGKDFALVKWHNCKVSRINKNEKMDKRKRYINQPVIDLHVCDD